MQACRQPAICGLPAAASEALVEKSLKEKMILRNVKELARQSLVSMLTTHSGAARCALADAAW